MLQALTAEIKVYLDDGTLRIAPLARTRMEAFGLSPEEVFDAIREGEAHPARENDRVKYIYGDVIVFVAVGKGMAFVTAAYPLMSKNH